MNRPEQPAREMLNTMLHMLPVHIFAFDSDLVCRYAAPIGTHFLGTRHDELFGRPLEGIFPHSLALRPQLEAVVRTRQPWRIEHLPYTSGPEDAWDGGAWRLEAQPYSSGRLPFPVEETGHVEMTGKRRAGKQTKSESAVLVSCIEKPSTDDVVPDFSQARIVSDALSDRTRPEQVRSAALVERVRTKLTVVRGFSQLLRRRQLRENPSTDLHELERIGEAVRELDEVLYQFEYSAR